MVEPPAATSVAKPATLVSNVLSLLGLASPASTDNPITPPAPAAVVSGALDLMRREIENFFDFRPPVADPRQVVADESDGVVLGTFDAVDPNRTPLTYEAVQQPKYGTVVVAENGTYVYTPNQDLTPTMLAQGFQDTFTVQVADKGVTLPNILAFIFGVRPGISVPVTVTVPPRPAQSAAQTADEADGVLGFGGLGPFTKGFNVFNATPQPIYVQSYGAHSLNQVTQAPPVGTVIQPGQSVHYEVVWYFAGSGQVNPTFASQDGKTSWTALMNVGGDLGKTQTARCSSRGGVCTPAYGARTEEVVLMTNPGGVIRVPAVDAQQQADVMNKTCASGIAQCSFVAKGSPVRTYEKPVEASSPFTNTTSVPIKRKLTAKVEYKNSYSVDVTAKVGLELKKIFSASLEATYGQKWENARTTEESEEVTINPGKTVTLYSQAPVVRYTGDMTIKMGNTTWELRNVSFDQPDTTSGRKPRIEAVETTGKPTLV